MRLMLMIFELLRRRRLRQRVVSYLLIAVADAALLCRANATSHNTT
jgi:hypothetical protein